MVMFAFLAQITSFIVKLGYYLTTNHSPFGGMLCNIQPIKNLQLLSRNYKKTRVYVIFGWSSPQIAAQSVQRMRAPIKKMKFLQYPSRVVLTPMGAAAFMNPC